MDSQQLQRASRFIGRGIGPSGHACLLYDDPRRHLDLLARYIGGGLWGGETAIVIASNARLARIDDMLWRSGLDLAHLRGNDRYIALSAEGTLPGLMVDGSPDPDRFDELAREIMDRARHGGGRVRAYSEMSALLWASGRYAPALRLEELWNGLVARDSLGLLCAFAKEDWHAGGAGHVAQMTAAHGLVEEV